MAKIKICGLYRPVDIEYVNEAKPDYCGFIINFPKSHRNVSPETVKEFVKALDGGITPVGVFVDQDVSLVSELLNSGTVKIAQLHGHEDDEYIENLRNLAPDKTIWKAFKIREKADLEKAQASKADMVLLDNGYGTGSCFDWSLAEGFDRPFMLAGGLTPENIPDAICRMKPFGVDISSGVETDKLKDRNKMLAAVKAAGRE